MSERERFEKWANEKGTFGNSWDGECYQNDLHHAAWCSWQAAIQAERERCAKIAARITDDWTCECGADDPAWKRKKLGKMYNTDCGHAFDCPKYHAHELADAIRRGEGV